LLSSCTTPEDLTCVDFKIGTFKGEGTNYQMPTLILERFEKTQKEFIGWRGVLYSENGVIKGDLINQVSGMGSIGIIKQTFEFKGDILLIERIGNAFEKKIYIKRKVPIELLKNKAEW
jgi:hypothetical protein